MKHAALITGASGGIGQEFAHIHAEHGGDVVIVARREDELLSLKKELEQKHNVSVLVLVKDLSHPDAPTEVFTRLQSANITIDYLFNNAGFGGVGIFHESDWHMVESMIDLNIKALTELTRLFLPGMIERKKGKILNVASTAGFMPGPLQAVYFATKAYVLSFSEGIAEEVVDAGVTVTALCPGPVATGFAVKAHLDQSTLFKSPKSARSVAECGYNAMLKGKTVVINQISLHIVLRWIIPFLPRRFVAKMAQKMMEQ